MDNLCKRCGKQSDRPLMSFCHKPQMPTKNAKGEIVKKYYEIDVCFPCYKFLSKEYVTDTQKARY